MTTLACICNFLGGISCILGNWPLSAVFHGIASLFWMLAYDEK